LIKVQTGFDLFKSTTAAGLFFNASNSNLNALLTRFFVFSVLLVRSVQFLIIDLRTCFLVLKPDCKSIEQGGVLADVADAFCLRDTSRHWGFSM
jgi:hypothetical protein